MTDQERLSALKTDLGITATEYDGRLSQYLAGAVTEIEREGATLDLEGSIDDNNLVIDFAAWTWRKRDTGEGMPRMIRYALNNRVFAEKMETEQ